MRFSLVNKETVITQNQCLVLRVMAVTNPMDYKHCQMLGEKTVRLQRQTAKHKFETFAETDNLHNAGGILEEYINNFTYGQKYARIQQEGIKMRSKEEFKFEIISEVKKLSETNEKGWTTELNVVKWGDNKPKADIRAWNAEHTMCGKGITLTRDECDQLFDGLDKLDKAFN